MNSSTGQIYRGAENIAEAIRRGEPIVPVSEHVADTMEAGQAEMNRRQRRAAQRKARLVLKQAAAK